MQGLCRDGQHPGGCHDSLLKLHVCLSTARVTGKPLHTHRLEQVPPQCGASTRTNRKNQQRQPLLRERQDCLL